MIDKPMTTAEVAEYLSVNEWTVRLYINQGVLKAHKLGNGTGKKGSKRRWRVWRSDLIEFINRNSNQGYDNDRPENS